MSSQFTGTRKSRPFGLYKTHYLPNLHRVGGSYFRPRPKRKGQQVSRQTANSAAAAAAAHAPLSTLKREPKNVTWLPGDDYLLIHSVLLTCNLTEVHQTVRFASYFTEKEVESRWRVLLFDPVISKTALQAIAQLPPLIKARLNRLLPFSAQEDALIAKVTLLDVFPDGETKPLSAADLRQSIFAKLLTDHPTVFFAGRDELDLFRQWSRLQGCHVIKDGLPVLARTSSNDAQTDATSKQIDGRTKTREQMLLSGVGPARTDTDTPLGGDPESFSDTELLLEETVASALSAGLDKLTEPSTAARRHHMLGQSSYHGFQSLVTESVIAALAKEEQQQQQQQERDDSDEPVCSNNRSWLAPHPAQRPGLATLSAGPSNRVGRPGTTSIPIPNGEFDFRRRMELYRSRKRLLARLRRTAEEAKRWTRLVEIRAASGLELIDPQPLYPVLAALTGTRTRFLLKEKEVTFGRSSLVYRPHIDLSREGDSSRVSRCHGRIRLSANGSFWLANFSKHPVFVDGNPVLTDEEVELKDLATVLISRLTFRFDVNHLYLNALCQGTDSAAAAAGAATHHAGEVPTNMNSRATATANHSLPSPDPTLVSDPASELSLEHKD